MRGSTTDRGFQDRARCSVRFVPCTLLGTDRIALGHRRALFLRRDGKIWSLAVGDSILPRESRPDPLELAGGMAELQTAVMKETNGHV